MQSRLILMMVTAVFATCLSSAGAVMAQSEKEITNSIGMKLVLIPKGTFQMGSPPSENGSRDNELQHEVTLTRDYYLGAFEVTQAQYEKVMGKNPSYFQGIEVEQRIPAKKDPQTGRTIEDEKIIPADSSNHPVEKVSWEEAAEFCKKLSELPEEQKVGRVYRLPTEAEWEYACRAGSKSAYSFGDEQDSLAAYAWFSENGDRKTHPVGNKKPNAWGLYDMHGNVWEWCADWYGDYPEGSASDPFGPKEGSYRVIRGGSWNNVSAFCRSARRDWYNPSRRNDLDGFRVALSSPEIPK